MWRERALYVGASFDFSMHKHHAVQICVGIHDLFDVSFGKGDRHHVRAALIAPDVPHQLYALDNEIAFVFLEPESTDYEALLSVNQDKRGFRVWDSINEKFAASFHLDSQTDEITAANLLTKTLEMVGIEPVVNSSIDERIARVLKRLDETKSAQCASEELESIACLSASRLQHLFKEQVGIPIRRYSLWTRIRYVMEQLNDGVRLTDAAIDAGFSDTAHFSRTFKDMFGVQPSAFMSAKGLVNIQIFERFRPEN